MSTQDVTLNSDERAQLAPVIRARVPRAARASEGALCCSVAAGPKQKTNDGPLMQAVVSRSRNQAEPAPAPSDAGSVTPMARGNLPNSLAAIPSSGFPERVFLSRITGGTDRDGEINSLWHSDGEVEYVRADIAGSADEHAGDPK
jgi:hypothetical protein